MVSSPSRFPFILHSKVSSFLLLNTFCNVPLTSSRSASKMTERKSVSSKLPKYSRKASLVSWMKKSCEMVQTTFSGGFSIWVTANCNMCYRGDDCLFRKVVKQGPGISDFWKIHVIFDQCDTLGNPLACLGIA